MKLFRIFLENALKVLRVISGESDERKMMVKVMRDAGTADDIWQLW